jgi:hypothetical protein
VPEDVLTDLPNWPASELTTNGVGPWKGLLPTEPFHDPVLLENGDSRNVVDRYRYWLLEAIVADLDESRHPFHVAIENWQHDMNIADPSCAVPARSVPTPCTSSVAKRWNSAAPWSPIATSM